MKHAHPWKQVVALLLALVLAVGLITPTWAVDETAASKGNVTWEKVDNDAYDIELPIKGNTVADDETQQYADTDVVRVSIVLSDPSTLEKGFTTQQIASANSKAIKYRDNLETKQEKMAKTISKKALRGETLDVVWNLTLAANIISANVEYGQIEAIEKVSGVEEVLIETRYEPCVVNQSETTDPNMATSDKMIGSTAAWASGYTGAGSKVAIIDTGADTDHPSLDPYAYSYAVRGTDAVPMTAADTAKVLSQLNIAKNGVTAEDLYVNAKIPFAYNYIDGDTDVTHDNDTEGDHGSHVTGIAAGNRYIANDDGTYSNALDTVLTQGVAPDAQVFTMKVFGKGGGAYDSDYMAAIEDAIVLGADSANLSLGSGNPGFSHNAKAAYQAILERVTESGLVVAMSAGNSGSWFENTPYGSPYADGVSRATNGSPGSFTNSLAVASVDNVGSTGNYVEVAGTKMFYNDTTDAPIQPMTALAGEHKFVYVDAPGNPSDFAAAGDEIKDAIALCNRGAINFTAKGNNAIAAGAIATIVVNNVVGTINMSTDGYTETAPYVSMTLADGLTIKANAEKKEANGVTYYVGTMKVGASPAVNDTTADYYTINDFSSWGVPGSLELKPEITAPGGNIYSLKDGGTYQNMSGTSMASPQVAGMAAVVGQYIRENNLTAKTGLSSRALTQSLLMSTATPMYEEFVGSEGNGYYPVLRQGAGLANVGAAVTSGSYILMDANATDSYKDGKVKAELGEDADRTGLYTFGFTIYNMEDTATAFNLDADFFTQDVFTNYISDSTTANFEDAWTTPIAANVSWDVDGKTIEVADASGMEHCDFNGDGKINADDGQALLDYVTGVRAEINDKAYADFSEDGDIDTYDAYLFFKRLGKSAVEVPANGSVHVTVTAQLSKAMLDMYDEASDGTGTYVEGYVYASELASAEGEEGTEHSIPVLGYYGSWTDASMYDIGSYLEYANGMENRVPYMYAAAGNNALKYQSLTVQYAGDSGLYYFGGNPYVEEDFYHEDRNAYNPDTTTFAKMYFSLIRNAANIRMDITGDDGKEYLSKELNQQATSAYYYTNGGTWQGTRSSLNFSAAPNAPEGTKLNISMTMAPEYYVDYSGETAVTDWDALSDGATMSYVAYVDKTAPEVSEVYFKEDLMNDTKQLVVNASDNRYIAAAILIDYDESKILDRVGGSPKDAKMGDAATLALDASKTAGVNHLLLRVYDYADNYSTFKINLNKEELEGDVTVTLDKTAMSLYKGGTGMITAEVSPFGIHPDGVTWTSDNEEVATVNANGIVTAVAKGTATITAASIKDPTATASCVVSVLTADTTIVGTLMDVDGTAQFYAWDLANDETWTPLVNTEVRSISSATFDARTGDVYIEDGEGFDIYKVDMDTGKTLATYKGFEGDIPMWDMEYSLTFSTAENPLLTSVYYIYFIPCKSPTNMDLSAFNFQSYLLLNAGASYFTAVSSLGTVKIDTDEDGVKDTTAEMFLLLDDAGNIWTMNTYPELDDEGNPSWSASFGIFESNLKDVGYSDNSTDEGDMYDSLYATVEGDDIVLYLSNFTGDTNNVYRILFTDEGTWDAALVGSFGDGVWPANIFGTIYHEDETVTNRVLEAMNKTETFSAESVQLTADQISRYGESKQAATGSLNAVTFAKSSPVLPLEAPVASESASNVTVSDDEKTVTVNVIAKSEDATTNGLATVEYDPSILTLTDVSMFADYTSHKDESGKVTLGYVDLDGVAAGTVVATLTFSVDPTKVDTDPEITIHQTEINDKHVDVTETLTAEFHKNTEVKDAHDATCTLEGYTGDTYCTVCGKKVASGTTTPAKGHSFGEWETVVAATCEGKGLEKRVCSVCQHTETRDIQPTGHDWEADYTVDVEPTCTVAGSKSIHCKKCDAKKDVTEIPANGHSYGEWVTIVAPKCQEKGMRMHTCSVCQHTEVEDLDPTGHDWEADFTIDKAATCTEDGSKSIHCKNCDAVKDSTVIPATGHAYGEPTWTWTGLESATATFTCANDETHVEVVDAKITNEVTTEPTCTEKGVRTYTATVEFEGKTYTDAKTEEIEATGHDTEIVGAKEATCTEDGYTGDEVCKTCKEVIKQGEVIPATGHDTEIVGAKEATCTEDGYTGDEVCKTCKEVVKKGEVIKATGHNFKNGKCTVCGKTQPNNVKTGDESHLGLWMCVLTFSAVAAAAVVTFLLRKKRNN